MKEEKNEKDHKNIDNNSSITKKWNDLPNNLNN